MNSHFLATPALLFAVLGGFTSLEARTDFRIHIGIPAPIVIHTAPPAPVVERVVVSPGPGYAWVPGHYVWHHRRWVWVRGTWIVPPRAGLIWVNGTWDARAGSWTEGHWEEAPVVEEYVDVAPPACPEEVVMVRPSRAHIWVSGYWRLENHRHFWVAGRWELPPRGCREWSSPRWEHRPRGYVFVPGRWH